MTQHEVTQRRSLPSNAIVERRFETIFAATRASVHAAPAPLKAAAYWSLAAFDATDKANYRPFRRDGILQPSSHTSMQLHVCKTGVLDGPRAFLPFGKQELLIYTRKIKRKLDDRTIPANYIRCLSIYPYQIYRRDKKSITSVRQYDLVLKREQAEQNQDAKNLPHQQCKDSVAIAGAPRMTHKLSANRIKSPPQTLSHGSRLAQMMH